MAPLPPWVEFAMLGDVRPSRDVGTGKCVPHLQLCAGARTALVGPNGSGKTTLLRLGMAALLLDLDTSQASWVGLGAMLLATGAAMSAVGMVAGAVVPVVKRGEPVIGRVDLGKVFPGGQTGAGGRVRGAWCATLDEYPGWETG